MNILKKPLIIKLTGSKNLEEMQIDFFGKYIIEQFKNTKEEVK
jgi:hypothetical protein